MASPKFICEKIKEAVCQNDFDTIDQWVNEGGQLYDESGWTIYYEVGGFGTIVFLQELLKRYPESAHLIRRRNRTTKWDWTSIHRCCDLARHENNNGHSIGLLDALCDAAGGGLSEKDNKNRTCMDLATGNKGLQDYIKWRLTHSSRLPPEIRRLNNRAVHQYIQTFGSMDAKSSKRYRGAIKGQTETSYCIRMVFLGHERVGKSTLMHRMTGQEISKVRPTNQLDVLLDIMMVDLVNNQRQLLKPDMEGEITRQRLKDVITGSMVSKQKSVKQGMKDMSNAIRKKVRRLSLSGLTNDLKMIKQLQPEHHKEAAILMFSGGPTEDFGQRGKKACVSIFDFGGEMMFSSFQHIFLNQSAVILLCFSLHNCFQNEAILERVSFWLRYLSIFSDKDDKYRPPVVLVGTHLDKVEETGRSHIKSRVFEHINKNRTVAQAYNKHVLAFVTVDNTLDAEFEYDNVWRHVLEAAKYQSQWGQLLPASWITLERDLLLKKSQGVKVMTLEEVKARAKNLVVPLEDQGVIAMLQYLHMIRTILSFQLDDPDTKIILDPKWLIEAFRMVVTTIKFQQKDLNPVLVKEFEKTRRLTLPFIDAAWSKNKSDDFIKHKDTILFYLDRLELIVRPLPNEDETSADYYIVPCLLEEANPGQVRPILDKVGTVKTPTLCFDFMGQFIPPAVFNKILASCIHRFEVIPVPGQHNILLLQQGLGCFVMSHHWNMVLHCKDSKIKITLFSEVTQKVEIGDGFMIRTVIEAIINATLDKNQQGHLIFKYFLSDDFEVTDREDKLTQVVPESKYESKTAVWFSERHHEEKPETSVSETELELLRRAPSPREMVRIAKHVGNNYTLFFIEMGMTDVWVEQLRRDHEYKRDFQSQLTRILIAWRDECGNKATFIRVKDAFEFCDLNFHALIEDIRKLHSKKDASFNKDIDISFGLQNSRPVEHELEDISILILKAYLIVFIELGVTFEHIELAEMDHHKALDLIKYLLQHWMKTCGEEATIIRLYNALKECRKACGKLIDLVKRRSSGSFELDCMQESHHDVLS